MNELDLRALGLPGNIAVLIGAAIVVWFAGSRLSRHASSIAEATGAGQAFIGTILLGVLVSLPEMAVAAVAAAIGNAELAVNSLLGGIGMTMVAVAATDAIVGSEPLSRDIRNPVVLLQGAMVIVMLAVAGAGMVGGDRPLPGLGAVGAWTTALPIIYVLTLAIVRQEQREHPWTPDIGQERAPSHSEGRHPRPARGSAWRAASAAAAVIVAGSLLAFSADALADQTGLGAGLIGFLLGGIATSLPELSTMIASVRLKRYEMAFSDAFGTNLCSLALLFLADVIYPGPPLLSQVGPFALFAVLLGIALTGIYLVGLIARSRRAVLRMGVDSIAVIAAAVIGFTLLFQL